MCPLHIRDVTQSCAMPCDAISERLLVSTAIPSPGHAICIEQSTNFCSLSRGGPALQPGTRCSNSKKKPSLCHLDAAIPHVTKAHLSTQCHTHAVRLGPQSYTGPSECLQKFFGWVTPRGELESCKCQLLCCQTKKGAAINLSSETARTIDWKILQKLIQAFTGFKFLLCCLY